MSREKTTKETQMSTSTVLLKKTPNGSDATNSRRLNLILSESARRDLDTIAAKTQRSLTEVVRLGLGLVRLAVDEAESGNRLVVMSKDGKTIKEVILPS
jgi:hypothetical protein